MRNFILALLFLNISFAAMAQENSSKENKIFADFEIGTSTMKQNSIATQLDLKTGYKILPYLSVYANFENSLIIEGESKMRYVYNTNALGGGINFDFLANTDRSIVFSLCSSLGTSIGKVDSKQSVYKAGLRLRLGTDKIHPSLELGYRVMTPRDYNTKKNYGLYTTIGISW